MTPHVLKFQPRDAQSERPPPPPLPPLCTCRKIVLCASGSYSRRRIRETTKKKTLARDFCLRATRTHKRARSHHDKKVASFLYRCVLTIDSSKMYMQLHSAALCRRFWSPPLPHKNSHPALSSCLKQWQKAQGIDISARRVPESSVIFLSINLDPQALRLSNAMRAFVRVCSFVIDDKEREQKHFHLFDL